MIIQILKRNSTLACHLHIFCIDLEYLIHCSAVEYDRILQCCFKSALYSRLTGARYNIDLVLISKFQDGSHILCAVQFYNSGRCRQYIYFVCLLILAVTVQAALFEYLFISNNVLFSYDSNQIADDSFS